jgi:hypothetical protein
MPKGTFLILDTDWSGAIVDSEIIDGKVLIKKGKTVKEFILSIPRKDANGREYWEDVKPIFFRGKLGGVKPMYILKWNCLYPLAFERKEETKKFVSPEGETITTISETLEPIKVSEMKDTKILPEMLAQTHDMRFLKSMKKVQTGGEINIRGILMFAGILLLLLGGGFLIYKLFLKR